jgi:hypothetical protein
LFTLITIFGDLCQRELQCETAGLAIYLLVYGFKKNLRHGLVIKMPLKIELFVIKKPLKIEFFLRDIQGVLLKMLKVFRD